MNDNSTVAKSDDDENASRVREQRARLARVFGDVLPDLSADERPGTDEPHRRDSGDASDDWLRREVPPHHG